MQATSYYAIDALIDHRYPRADNYERGAAFSAAKDAGRRGSEEDPVSAASSDGRPIPRFRALLIRSGIVGA